MGGRKNKKPPPHPSPGALFLTLFVKVNITVTLHTLKSLALVSGNARHVYVLLGPAGRIAIFLAPLRTSFFFPLVFFICFLFEALPTCVIVWPLSACLLQSTLQQPSPPPKTHPPSPARSLPPCGSLQTGFPPLPPHPPYQALQAKSSSFRTGPPVLKLLLLLRQSLSSATSSPAPSLCLSCKDHFSQRWRHLICFFFFFFTYGIASVHFCFIVIMKFADIVAVIVDDVDDDCFLMMMMMISWLFNIGLYAVFSYSPAPPTPPLHPYHCLRGRLQVSVEKARGGVLFIF